MFFYGADVFMAINDWNHNGKKDLVDSIIEYQIYKDVMGDKDEKHQSYKSHKSHSDKARTTDGKYVSGNDINGGVVVLSLLVAVLAFVFIIAAMKTEDNVMSFILIILGIAVAIFGKWLLMGKRVIKNEAQKKYGIENEDENKEEL